jgi:hypothetical protein
MNIKVTKHAIRRYRERLFDFSSSNEQVAKILQNISTMGKMIQPKPNFAENCFEIKYKGISIVIIEELDTRVIITCLGEDSYRKWIKTEGVRLKISQRILFIA